MIEIKNKVDCCGCSSCVQACPKKCISFEEDYEGFRYPKVNKKTCVGCGLCEQICPVLHNEELVSREPTEVIGAKNKDENIRMQSSSGGIFTILAEKVIKQGGVVFGAGFNEKWEVEHGYTDNIEGLSAFRGSKYVQSRIGNNFIAVKRFLREGRYVLFSGTPCQIAGLRFFLKKDYENLICVDFVCHGVPSPKVWRKYLKFIARQGDGKNSVSLFSSKPNAQIEGISFREKSIGWKKFSFAFILSKASAAGEKNTVSHSHVFTEDSFMKVFLQDIILRPSCYDCKFRCQRSGSDITIGDFWGVDIINKEFDDDKGVSLVIINTEKGKKFFPQNQTWTSSSCYEDICRYNPSLKMSSKQHFLRPLYFILLPFCGSYVNILNNGVCHTSRMVNRLIRKVRSLIG